MYTHTYIIFTIPRNRVIVHARSKICRLGQVGKQLLVAVGMDSTELDDVLDVALNVTEQCMSLKVGALRGCPHCVDLADGRMVVGVM